MMNARKCARCGKPATHKFIRLHNGEIEDTFLCTEHAAQESPYQKTKLDPGISDFLEAILKQDSEAPSGSEAPPDLKCQSCGLSFIKYKKTLMLGCPQCYVDFRDYLMADLRRFHGAQRHVGRVPGPNALPVEPLKPPRIQIPAEESAAAPTEENAGAADSPTKGGQALLNDPRQAIAELIRSMEQAIRDEDFPRAARHRDQIREIKQEHGL